VTEVRDQRSEVSKTLALRPLLLALSCFGALLFALCFPVQAQQPKKMARIGYLSARSGPFPALVAFKEGLRELGWVERKQIEFEYRYAGADLDKLSEFATDLVRLKVDVIVAGPDNGPTHAAKRVTTTIPIVMVGVIDPVSNGLVASLARPGANVTGVTYEVTREQAGKNLELLKEAVPKLSRVAILRNPNASTQILYSKEAERAAKILGVTIQFAEMQARNDKGLEDALGAVVNERANALLVTPDPFFADHRHQIINFAARNKLPAIYFGSGFVNNGGLMSYGPYPEAMWRRAATYVDRILNGAKPADLPVEQPSKLELVINLKTAKQIGLTIPPNVLARADRVIR
jgi:putative tryptophan/tyrosine transport system substrate-binding protein